MLEQSPSAAAPVAVDSAPPSTPEAPPGETTFVRARSQRIGVGGILAIAWLVFVVLCAIFVPMFVESPSDPGLLAGQGMFKVSGHPLGGDSAGNDMTLQLAKGARSSLIVAIGAVVFGLTVGH